MTSYVKVLRVLQRAGRPLTAAEIVERYPGIRSSQHLGALIAWHGRGEIVKGRAADGSTTYGLSSVSTASEVRK